MEYPWHSTGIFEGFTSKPLAPIAGICSILRCHLLQVSLLIAILCCPVGGILAAAAGIRRYNGATGFVTPAYGEQCTCQTVTCLGEALRYAGPLLLVLISRFLTLSAMALYAASLGTTALAAYQVHVLEASLADWHSARTAAADCFVQVLINLYTLFGLFGEPLSQAAQAMLPPLLERKAGWRHDNHEPKTHWIRDYSRIQDRRGVRRAMRILCGIICCQGQNLTEIWSVDECW